MAEEEPLQPIIIKRVIKKGGGHHGGAWKVAYADFVTAMMAFFLLLWLLNVTTEDQRNAISNYFDPTHPKIADNTSGAGGIMGGLTTAPEGAMTSDVQPITPPPVSTRVPNQSQMEEQARFEEAEAQIKEAIAETPGLAEMAENLIVDMTPEGLRIQIVDSEGRSMFASGSADMYPETQALVAKVTEIIQGLPNDISIRGHTDSVPYGSGAKYTNWELSADRANTSRRVIEGYGFPAARINGVVGKADTEHLVKENPKDPKNRRISLILLKEEITDPEAAAAAGKSLPTSSDGLPMPAAPANTGSFKKTPGQVQFP
jgi:chemotaxis protein MotB